MNQPPTADTATAPLSGNERDILLTLFDLGRKVASVIDLDELLPKIPELVGRLIPFDAFAVYFFKEKRDRAVDRLRRGLSRQRQGFQPAVRQQACSAASSRRSSRSSSATSRPIRTTSSVVPGHDLDARGAAHSQGQVDRRAERAQPRARSLLRTRRRDSAPVRRARRHGARQRAALRAAAARRRSVRDAGRDRPRRRRRARPRRAARRGSRSSPHGSWTTGRSGFCC